MSDYKIQGEVSLNTENADQALIKVERGANRMADAIVGAGKKAGQGLSDVEKGFAGIGAGGDASSSKVEKSTKSIINSIQRTTAQMEAGTKTSSKYFETLANQRGIPVDALRPYLDQLDKVQQAQKSVGISAAQTAAAMRNVPAQFTDIITSLQGGQKPLTVLLQQGGQLKDMFGGVGNAARAMGSYVVGLVNPVTVAGAAVASLGYIYSQSNEQAKAFSKSIITSGNAAGVTTDQLMSSAKRINDLGISSQSVASDALNGLVASGNVSSEVLDQAAQAAIKSQKLLGVAVEDTVKAFSDLGKSPTKTLETLNEKYHFLTLEIYEQIKALEDQGRKAQAAQLAQSAYADAIINQSSKVSATLTDWERGWNRIKNASSGAFDSAMRIFDDPTSEEKIAKLFKEREKLEESQKRLAGDNSFINIGNAARVEKLLEQNKAEINAIRDKIKAKNDEAKAEEAKNKQVQAGIEFSSIVERNMTKAQKLELELARVRNVGLAAGKSEKEIEQQLAIVRENGAEKTKKAIEKTSLAWQVSVVEAKASGEAQKKIYTDLEATFTSYAKTVEKYTKDIVEQWQAGVRVQNSLDEYARSVEASAEFSQLELSLLGKSNIERNTAIEQYRIQLDLEKKIRDIRKENLSEQDQINAISRATEIANQAKSQAGIKAQQEEWTKFYSDIYNGLSDSLYRGFEAGKGFFQNFWDGIKNLFKTTVLKLAVQGVMTGVLGGIAGTASAAGSSNPIGSVFDAVSAGKSLFEGFTAAGSLGSGFWGSLAGGLQGAGAGSGLTSSLGLSIGNSIQSTLGSSISGSISSGLSSIASAMPYAAAAAAVFALSKSVNGGYRLGGLSADAGAALGFAPRLFGMQDKQLAGQTVTGMLGTDNISRNVSWTQKGGLFRSDRSGVWSYGLKDSTAIQDGKSYQDTANVKNDSAMLKFLNESYAAIKSSTVEFAKTLGLNADDIASRNDALNVTLGTTAEETNAAIQKALGNIADSIAASVLPGFKDLAKEGETAAGTLARVAVSFGGINKMLGDIGLKLFQLNDAGIKAASSFADLFGGLEGLQTVSASYYENFFNQEEKTANALKAVGAEFDKLSLGTLPSTRAEYRKLVEDISKTGNAEQLAGLLKLSGAFAAVIPDAQAVVEKVEKVDESLSRFTAATDAAASPLVRVSSALEDTSEAAQKAASILSERNNLQEQIDAATMTSAQILEKQRNALDESNRAKFDELQVALSSKQAAEALAQTNKGILDQIESLLKANETVEQSRARELKGLDESTAALKRRLYSLQDEAKAQAELKARQEASTASMNSMIEAVMNGSAATQKSLQMMVESMTNARDALITGAQSGFSTDDRLSLLKGQMATASDSELPALANNYLQALRESGVGSVDYQREFALIVNRLDAAAVDAQMQYQQNLINEPSRLAAWAGMLAEDKKKSDVRDALNSEYSTYARELPSLSVNGFTSNSLDWGNKLVAALDGFSSGKNTVETTEKLIAEIQALRAATEKSAAILDSVTAGGNAMLTEQA